MSRRTKIVATLGPATDDDRVLDGLIAAGLDVARVNFSHGTAADHKRRVEQVRTRAAAAGRDIGVFEFDQFGEGTRALAHAIAESAAFSIAGGGDTLAAVEKYGVTDRISYISTGGGAFLEFLEGKTLPAVAMLERRAQG